MKFPLSVLGRAVRRRFGRPSCRCIIENRMDRATEPVSRCAKHGF